MDGTVGRSQRFPRVFMVAAGALMASWGGAVATASEPSAFAPLPPETASSLLDCSRYQGVVWASIGLLLLQSTAVVLLLRNVRRRRETEAQLRASEERFRLLVENSLSANYLIDRDGIIQYANRTLCAMFGYQQEDLVGKMSFRAIIAPDDLPRVAANFANRLEGLDIPARYEAGGLHRNGELIDLEILGTLAHCAGKSVVIGSLLDITQRKQAESNMLQERQQREEMNRTLERRIREEVGKSREKDKFMLQQSRFAAMGEMIGNIAHHWRQPLNKLGMVLQRMQMEQEKGVLTDRLMEERVGHGMDLLLSLSRTIDDFRNFFRPERDPAPFSLSGAVVKTVDFFRASCTDHDIKISIEGESTLIHNGHVVEFRQVLLNILNNARDALLEGGGEDRSIFVAMRDEEQRSVLTIRDNAGGIDPEIMHKIFDPYFTTKGKGNRTGIGLYMAKTIIDQNMQGRIFVRNLAEGAEFRIVL